METINNLCKTYLELVYSQMSEQQPLNKYEFLAKAINLYDSPENEYDITVYVNIEPIMNTGDEIFMCLRYIDEYRRTHEFPWELHLDLMSKQYLLYLCAYIYGNKHYHKIVNSHSQELYRLK